MTKINPLTRLEGDGRRLLAPFQRSRPRRWPGGPGGWGPWQVLQVSGLAAVAVLTSGLLLIGVLHVTHQGQVPDGVVVANRNLGGLHRSEARRVLADLTTAQGSTPVVFTYQDRQFVYTPGKAGYQVNADEALAMVLAAMEPHQAGGLPSSLWAHLGTLWNRRVQVRVPGRVDQGRLASWIADTADRVDQPPFPGRVTADPQTLEVKAEQPRVGVQVRRDQAQEQAVAAIRRPGPDRIPLPARQLPPPTSDRQVRQVADQARRALESPLTLTARDRDIVLEPSDIARLISSRVTTGSGRPALVLHVPQDATEEAFDPYLDFLDAEPRSAGFEVVSGLTTFDDKDDAAWSPRPAKVRVTPSREGSRFDPARVSAQLSELLAAGRRTADLDLTVLKPDLSTAEAQALNISHLIGTFTTYHACCQPRVENIHRMADIVRGTVVEPGKTFSVNGVVGRRTRAKGFVADGTIVDGELVDEVGGGVSQFATTTFNAAFFAGLDITEYKPHSYYISRYPMGREATLYYPSLDLKFRNTTDHGILVHTSYTDTSITVSLFGNNGGQTVRVEHGKPYNYRSPGTQHRHNPDLAPGTRRVIQSSEPAFSVVVYRYVDGEKQRFVTNYPGRPTIVEVG